MSICAAYLSAKESGFSADAALRAVHTHYESVPIEMAEYVVFSALVLFPVHKALEMEVCSRPGSKPASIAPRALYTGGGTKPDKQLAMLHQGAQDYTP